MDRLRVNLQRPVTTVAVDLGENDFGAPDPARTRPVRARWQDRGRPHRAGRAAQLGGQRRRPQGAGRAAAVTRAAPAALRLNQHHGRHAHIQPDLR
jgi:hypothetical protein